MLSISIWLRKVTVSADECGGWGDAFRARSICMCGREVGHKGVYHKCRDQQCEKAQRPQADSPKATQSGEGERNGRSCYQLVGLKPVNQLRIQMTVRSMIMWKIRDTSVLLGRRRKRMKECDTRIGRASESDECGDENSPYVRQLGIDVGTHDLPVVRQDEQKHQSGRHQYHRK
jgi:hypothetical protein